MINILRREERSEHRVKCFPLLHPSPPAQESFELHSWQSISGFRSHSSPHQGPRALAEWPLPAHLPSELAFLWYLPPVFGLVLGVALNDHALWGQLPRPARSSLSKATPHDAGRGVGQSLTHHRHPDLSPLHLYSPVLSTCRTVSGPGPSLLSEMCWPRGYSQKEPSKVDFGVRQAWIQIPALLPLSCGTSVS